MRRTTISMALLTALGLGAPLAAADGHFDLQASFLVCENTRCDKETSSEIIAVSSDGTTLVYSDSPGATVGLIDITDPVHPGASGAIHMGENAEPTSVAVLTGFEGEDYIVVAVNTSPDFDANFYGAHSGELRVYTLAECKANAGNCAPLATFNLNGQPDSVAVSPDGRYIAVAVENERDESACYTEDGTPVPAFYGEEDQCVNAGNLFGRLPQPKPGWLAVLSHTDKEISNWSLDTVDLVGKPGLLYPADPEPEFVSINSDNKAVLSLQENNAVAIIDLPTLTVENSYSAGAVNLHDIDTEENGLIELSNQQAGRLREPDGVTWLGSGMFASANEGDMDGGSRGFTIFTIDGKVVYESYESYDYLQVRYGHYPEERSENKGSEPEAVSYAPDFAGQGRDLLFVGAERSSTVAVYDATDPAAPVFKQLLPAVIGPESMVPVTTRTDGVKLLAVANEVDDVTRSMVNLFVWREDSETPTYPTVVSADDPMYSVPSGNGFWRPIPWGALSGLTRGDNAEDLYAIHDSFYKEPRIFHIDQSVVPAMITGYTKLYNLNQSALDSRDLKGVDQRTDSGFAKLYDTDPIALDALDLEGIARRADGGFWLASEGTGTYGDDNYPFEDENLLIRVAADGRVLEQVHLPADVAAKQVRFGFEGVAVTGAGNQEHVWVAFQREWTGDPAGLVRIGEYRPYSGEWAFYWYPLDPREADSGWVGVSELVAVSDRQFLVLERDNQGGPYAKIKRVYRVDLDEGRDTFAIESNDNNAKIQSVSVLRKTLVKDLLPVFQAENGWVPDKPEGMTVDAGGNLVLVTDNDGVDDATGQTWFFNLGPF